MKKIINVPKSYNGLCDLCGCEFTYEYEDIEVKESNFGIKSKYVICPNCGEICSHSCYLPRMTKSAYNTSVPLSNCCYNAVEPETSEEKEAQE